jgi:putative glutamine amidotransferase
MQVLVDFWGGAVTRVEGHVARPHELRVASDAPAPLRSGPVNSFHDWGVAAEGVPAPLRVLATAPDGSVEAVAHTALPQIGVMWHPERPAADSSDRALLATMLERRR